MSDTSKRFLVAFTGTKVNGRRCYFDHLTEFKQIGKGKYTVKRGDVEYQIEGGKHLGGSRRDWYVDGPDWKGSITCKSLMDALRMLETM